MHGSFRGFFRHADPVCQLIAVRAPSAAIVPAQAIASQRPDALLTAATACAARRRGQAGH
ncbi:MAG: hypothetical protein GC152_11555 [Alphaproteobacteria bacterium]|nr:hypothetical protein [Alphaproteobacteria bacterium]